MGVRSGLVLAVAAAAGVPVRIARLQSDGDERPSTAYWQLLRLSLRLLMHAFATDVLGVSHSSLEFASPPAGDARYRVMPNGVDVERFARARKRERNFGSPPVLVHVGRAAPEKNRGFLLEVLAEVRRQCADVSLVFAGPGGTADLEAVDHAVLSDRAVRLVGETDEVEHVLADCDVLLLPSYREGLPGVVLEALAAGVPVLAADLPGLLPLQSELDGLTLLPLRAGPGAWAAAALRLARTPLSERDEISDTLCRSRFTLAHTADTWRELWTRHPRRR